MNQLLGFLPLLSRWFRHRVVRGRRVSQMVHVAVLFTLVRLATVLAQTDEDVDADVRALYSNIINQETPTALSISTNTISQLDVATKEYVISLLIDRLSSTNQLGKLVNHADTKHDLNLEAGRCAWVLEKLLSTSLPPITANTPARDLTLAAYKSAVWARRAQSKVQVAGKTADLPPEQRLSLASDTNTSFLLLAELALDEWVDVRAAVAANPSTSIFTILFLNRTEQDGAILETVRKNLMRSRTLQSDPWYATAQ